MSVPEGCVRTGVILGRLTRGELSAELELLDTYCFSVGYEVHDTTQNEVVCVTSAIRWQSCV